LAAITDAEADFAKDGVGLGDRRQRHEAGASQRRHAFARDDLPLERMVRQGAGRQPKACVFGLSRRALAAVLFAQFFDFIER
jgi:hypothetical protein